MRKAAGGLPVVTRRGRRGSAVPAARAHRDRRVGSSRRSAHGEYAIDLAGGYGGVPGNLWTAQGGARSEGATASIELEAAQFQLERLAPILARSAVVDYGAPPSTPRSGSSSVPAGAKFSASSTFAASTLATR